MKILIVDDEPLARARLRRMLGELPETAQAELEEAADAAEAWGMLRRQVVDVLLLDIQMPGSNGMELAQRIAADPSLPQPAIVFVTAHEEHALDAFSVSAVDYLTKPVRRDRLVQAIVKAQRLRGSVAADVPTAPRLFIAVQERSGLVRVPLDEVLYCRAEDKYTILRTLLRTYLADLSLVELEQRHPDYFLRLHRSVLVAMPAMRALERPNSTAATADADTAVWTLHLHGVDDTLPVSRRRVSAVQAALRQSGT